MQPRRPNTADAAANLELRPGGMVVQKRDDVSDVAAAENGPIINIRVACGSSVRDLAVPAKLSFGELKRTLAQESGLEPQKLRLLFRGKERDDGEYLHMAGVKDNAKLVLLENKTSEETKVKEIKIDEGVSKACEAVAIVRAEVDKLAEKVVALESAVHSGKKVEEKEFVVLTELLMVQLLKLDGIEAEGEAKVQRKTEVRHIQSYVEALDSLKARNSNPFSNSSKSVAVTTQWETFENGVGSLTAPPSKVSSTTITKDWEHFDQA